MNACIVRFQCGYTMPFASDRVQEGQIVDHATPCHWCGGLDKVNNPFLRTEISSTKPFPHVIDGNETAAGDGSIRGSSTLTADVGPAASKSEKDADVGGEKTEGKWSVGKAAISVKNHLVGMKK